MTDDELRALALRLAHKHGDCVSDRCDFEFDKHGLVAIVRAAVAHGLRMGVEVCRVRAMAIEDANTHRGRVNQHGQFAASVAYNLANDQRAKADELEWQP